MNFYVATALGVLISYLLGSIPFAIVVGQGIYRVDIRDEGSGNTGATNVLRVLGWRAGLTVCALDVAKGAAGPLLMMLLLKAVPNLPSETMQQIAICLCALMPTIGHTVSPFLRFRGGKGVATTAGTILVLCLPAAGCAFIVFLLCVFITRYVSVGSMVGIMSISLFTLLFEPQNTVLIIYFVLVGLFVIYLHRTNIVQLIHGEERKFSVGNKKPAVSYRERGEK